MADRLQYNQESVDLHNQLYNLSTQYATNQGIYDELGKYADENEGHSKHWSLLNSAEEHPKSIGMQDKSEVNDKPIKASANVLFHKNAEVGTAIYQGLKDRGQDELTARTAAVQYIKSNLDGLKDRNTDRFKSTINKFSNVNTKTGELEVDTSDISSLIGTKALSTQIDSGVEALSTGESIVSELTDSSGLMSLGMQFLSWTGMSDMDLSRRGMYRDWVAQGGGVQSKAGKIALAAAGVGLSVAEMVLISKATAGLGAATTTARAATTANKLKRLWSAGGATMIASVSKGAYQDLVENNAFSKKYFGGTELQRESHLNQFVNSRLFDTATYMIGSAIGSKIEAGVIGRTLRDYNSALRSSQGAASIARKMAHMPIKSVAFDTLSDMSLDLIAHNTIESMFGGEGKQVFTESQRRMLDLGQLTPEGFINIAAQRLGARAFQGVIRNHKAVLNSIYKNTKGDMTKDPTIVGTQAWYENTFKTDNVIGNWYRNTVFSVGNKLGETNLADINNIMKNAGVSFSEYLRSENFNKDHLVKLYISNEKSKNMFLSMFMDLGGKIRGENIKYAFTPLSTTDSTSKLAMAFARDAKIEIDESKATNIEKLADIVIDEVKAGGEEYAGRKAGLQNAMFTLSTNVKRLSRDNAEVLHDRILQKLNEIDNVQPDLIQNYRDFNDAMTARQDVGQSATMTADDTQRITNKFISLSTGNYEVTKGMLNTAEFVGKAFLDERKQAEDESNLFTKMFPNYEMGLNQVARDISKELDLELKNLRTDTTGTTFTKLSRLIGDKVNKMISEYSKELENIFKLDVGVESETNKARRAFIVLNKIHLLGDAYGYKALPGLNEFKERLDLPQNKELKNAIQRIGRDSKLFSDKMFTGLQKYENKEDWISIMTSDLISQANKNIFNLNQIGILQSSPTTIRTANTKYLAMLQAGQGFNDNDIRDLVGVYQSRLSSSSPFFRPWEDEISVYINGNRIDSIGAYEATNVVDVFHLDPSKYQSKYGIEQEDDYNKLTTNQVENSIKYAIKKLVDYYIHDYKFKEGDTAEGLTTKVISDVNTFLSEQNIDSNMIRLTDISGRVIDNVVESIDKSDRDYEIGLKINDNIKDDIENYKSNYSSMLKAAMDTIYKYEGQEEFGDIDLDEIRYIKLNGQPIDSADLLNNINKESSQGFSIKSSIDTIVRMTHGYDDSVKAVIGFLDAMAPNTFKQVKESDRRVFAGKLIRDSKIKNFNHETLTIGKYFNEITKDISPIVDASEVHNTGQMNVYNIYIDKDKQDKIDDDWYLNNLNGTLLYGTGVGFVKRFVSVEGYTPEERMRAILNKMTSMIKEDSDRFVKGTSESIINSIRSLEGNLSKGTKSSFLIDGVKRVGRIILENYKDRNKQILDKLPEKDEVQRYKEDLNIPELKSLITTELQKSMNRLLKTIDTFEGESDTEINNTIEAFGLEGFRNLDDSNRLDELESSITKRLQSIIDIEVPNEKIQAMQSAKDSISSDVNSFFNKLMNKVNESTESKENLEKYWSEYTKEYDKANLSIVREDYPEDANTDIRTSDIIVELRSKVAKQDASLDDWIKYLNTKVISEKDALEFAYSYLAFGEGLFSAPSFAKRGGTMPLRQKKNNVNTQLQKLINDDEFNVVFASSKDILGTNAGDGLYELPATLYKYYNNLGLNGLGTKMTLSGNGNIQKIMGTSNIKSIGKTVRDISTGRNITIGENDIVVYTDTIKSISPEFLKAIDFIDITNRGHNGNAYKVNYNTHKDFIDTYLQNLTLHSSLSSRGQRVAYSSQIELIDGMYTMLANTYAREGIDATRRSIMELRKNGMLSLSDPEAMNRMFESTLRKSTKQPGALSILAPMRKLDEEDNVLFQEEELKSTSLTTGKERYIPNTAIISHELLAELTIQNRNNLTGKDLDKSKQIENELIEHFRTGTKPTDDLTIEALDYLTRGNKPTLLKTKTNGKDSYWITSVRYPNQLKGQTTQFLIKGVRESGLHQGIELSPWYVQKMQKADYDGDRVNILPVSSSQYLNMIQRDGKAIGVTEEDLSPHIVDKAYTDIIDAQQYTGMTIEAKSIKKDFDMRDIDLPNIDMASGIIIKALDDILYYNAKLGFGLNRSDVTNSLSDIITSVNKDVNEQFGSEFKERYTAQIDDSNAANDAWSLMKGDMMTLDKTTGSMLGSFRDVIIGNEFIMNGKTYRLARAAGGNDGEDANNFILFLENDAAGYGYKVNSIMKGIPLVGKDEQGQDIILSSRDNMLESLASKSSYLSYLNDLSENINNAFKQAIKTPRGADLDKLFVDTMNASDSTLDRLKISNKKFVDMKNEIIRLSNSSALNFLLQNAGTDAASKMGVQILYSTYFKNGKSDVGEAIRNIVGSLFASRFVPIGDINNGMEIVSNIGRSRVEGEVSKITTDNQLLVSNVIENIRKGLVESKGNFMNKSDFDILFRNKAKTTIGDDKLVELLETANKYSYLADTDSNLAMLPEPVYRALLLSNSLTKDDIKLFDKDTIEQHLESPEDLDQIISKDGNILLKHDDGFYPALEISRANRMFNIINNMYGGSIIGVQTAMNKYIANLKQIEIVVDKGIDTEDKLYSDIAKRIYLMNRNGDVIKSKQSVVSKSEIRDVLNKLGIKFERDERIVFSSIRNKLAMFDIKDPNELRARMEEEYNKLDTPELSSPGLRVVDSENRPVKVEQLVRIMEGYLGTLQKRKVKNRFEIFKAQSIFNSLIGSFEAKAQNVIAVRSQGVTAEIANEFSKGDILIHKPKYTIDSLRMLYNMNSKRKLTIDAGYLSPDIVLSSKNITEIVCR